MNALSKFRKSIMLAIKVLMVLALTCIFLGFWQTFYGVALAERDNIGSTIVILSYLVLLVTFTVVYGGFRIGVYRTYEVMYSISLAVLFTNFISYLELCLLARQMLPIGYFILMMFLQVGCIGGMALAANTVYFELYQPKHILTIFDNARTNVDLIRKMITVRQRYRIEKGITIDRDVEDIKKEIDRFEAVLIGDFDKKLKNELFRYAYIRGKRIYMLPSMNEIVINNSDQIQISDAPVLVCKNAGPSTEQLLLKRLMDICISAFGILISSPFMLIIALAIKLNDGGKVLYKQKRVTKNGKQFNIYKFRSMREDAEKNGAQKATEDDDRITRVGKIIRRIRMDELPQLFNVLFGQMSIVGPRPERIENVEEYNQTLPEFDLRHRVKAGITGYAQIYGKYNTSPSDKLNMDLIYIERYSLLMDIKLLFMTVKILFVKESTEGFQEQKSTK